MSTLSAFVRFEIGLLLGLLVIVIGYQILTGRINANNLLYDKDQTQAYSPGRLQALYISLSAAGFFLLEVLRNPTLFPDVPAELVWAVGGSNLLYLGGKSRPLASRRIAENVNK